MSKVGQPGIVDACVVGYVDALANPQANDLARQVADTMADGFACRVDVPDFHGEPLSLQRVLGFLMSPLTWLMGIPWDQSAVAGALLGTKTVLNEFLAYIDLGQVPPDQLSPRSRLIMTYALCGFANFGSLGIMIGGLGALAPERRAEVAALGLRSILAGTLATLMTGALVGALL